VYRPNLRPAVAKRSYILPASARDVLVLCCSAALLARYAFPEHLRVVFPKQVLRLCVGFVPFHEGGLMFQPQFISGVIKVKGKAIHGLNCAPRQEDAWGLKQGAYLHAPSSG
jgi:hypothetical protein